MIRHQVRGPAEPEVRDLAKHLALAGYRVRQHDVECAEAVRSNDQQFARGQSIDVAHLATMDQVQARQAGLMQDGGHARIPSRKLECIVAGAPTVRRRGRGDW
jgi:hypothetical protein